MSVLAADLGGTKIAAALVGENGQIVGRVVTTPTPAAAGAAAISSALIGVLREVGTTGASRIAISSAGVIDSRTGTVVDATSNLAGWKGTSLAADVSASLGLPVSVLGDGHAFALGEALYGAAKGARSCLVLAVGTGVGGSFLLDGTPMLGSHWAAGHFGHLPVAEAVGIPCPCGRTGHLEAVGSGSGMVAWYHNHGGDRSVQGARQLFERADMDAVATSALEVGGAALGAVAGGLTNAYDPDLVVIAGGVVRSDTAWSASVEAGYRSNLMPVVSATPLILSNRGDWLALRGAAHFAANKKEAW